jgi:hypothetical protein
MPKRTVPARGGAMPASGPTLEQWSSIDFKPWKRTKGDQPPTPARWRELWNPHGLNMRIAWEICHKTKPEITQIAREMLANQRFGRVFMESFTSSIEFLKDMSKLLETAEARVPECSIGR